MPKIKTFEEFKEFIKLLREGSPGVAVLNYFESDNIQRFESHFEQSLGEFRVLALNKIKHPEFGKPANFDDVLYWFVFKNAKPNELEEFFLKVYQRVSGKKAKDPISEDLGIEFKDNIDYYYPGSEEK